MLIIGVAGGSASGKSTVVNTICNIFKNDVALMPQDSYYKDLSHLELSERQKQNFDHPKSIDFDLLIKQVNSLKNGEEVEQPLYSFITCCRSTEETLNVKPADVIIVEGILIFTCKELIDLLDIKIFVDAEADERLMRLLSRDIVERGKTITDVMERYSKTVKPMHLQFIEPSKRYADIIIPLGGHNKVAINIIKATIEKAIKEKK